MLPLTLGLLREQRQFLSELWTAETEVSWQRNVAPGAEDQQNGEIKLCTSHLVNILAPVPCEYHFAHLKTGTQVGDEL